MKTKFVLRLMRLYNILTARRLSFNRSLNDLKYNYTTKIRQGLTGILKQTERNGKNEDFN